MEFTIIKILDGIFLAHRSLMVDYEFISNNKISHIACWLSPLIDQSTQGNISEKQALQIMRMMGISNLVVQRNSQRPIQNEVSKVLSVINQSREEQLCCLLLADNVLDTLWFIVPYLSSRFNWSFSTSIGYIQKKMDLLSIPGLQDIVGSLKNNLQEQKHSNQIQNNSFTPLSIKQSHQNDQYEQIIDDSSEFQFQFLNIQTPTQISTNSISISRRKQILWNDENFLRNYKTEDMDQLLLINTMKNVYSLEISNFNENNQKLGKRIKWFDQSHKNLTGDQRLFGNTKINTSIKKNQNIFVNSFTGTMSVFGQNSQITNYASRPMSGKQTNQFSNTQKQKNSGIKYKPVLKNCPPQNQQQNEQPQADLNTNQIKGMSKKVVPSIGLENQNKVENRYQSEKKRKSTILKFDKQVLTFDDPDYQELKDLSRTNFSDLLVNGQGKRKGKNQRKLFNKNKIQQKYASQRLKLQENFENMKDDKNNLRGQKNILTIGSIAQNHSLSSLGSNLSVNGGLARDKQSKRGSWVQGSQPNIRKEDNITSLQLIMSNHNGKTNKISSQNLSGIQGRNGWLKPSY